MGNCSSSGQGRSAQGMRKSQEEVQSEAIYAYKEEVKKRSLPLLEMRSSCESLDAATVQSVKAEFAAAKIQTQIRRKRALEAAAREQKWLVFSSMDAFDEAEMVKLSRFMNMAIERVGGGEQQQQQRQEQQQESRAKLLASLDFRQVVIETASVGSSGGGGEVEEDDDDVKLKGLDPVIVSDPCKLDNWQLPLNRPVTPDVARSVIEVLRFGGKLSLDSMIKLLRLCYRRLKALPNTTRLTLRRRPEERLVVVGDIHGQLADLLYILDEAGLPSDTTTFLFNGDFVDRGPCSCEVMSILMSLFLAFPNSVHLNRGNHEDFAVCCMYGFQQECCEKYSHEVFGMFGEVFQHLPMFCLVNDAILVLHGGLFHADDVTLEDLDAFDRTDFSLKDVPLTGEVGGAVPRSDTRNFFQQLQRDALWSDPAPRTVGVSNSARGVGIRFGPDVARDFLTRNKIKMVVRSHQTIRTGFDLPFDTGDDDDDGGGGGDVANDPEEKQMVATIFSASNYNGGGNSAAFMVFALAAQPLAPSAGSDSTPVVGTDLEYRVHRFKIDCDSAPSTPASSFRNDDAVAAAAAAAVANVTSGSARPAKGAGLYSVSLHELIIKKQAQLLEAFQHADEKQHGVVSRAVWASVMKNVTQLKIRWLAMLRELVPVHCVAPLPVRAEEDDSSSSVDSSFNSLLGSKELGIAYVPFLQSVSALTDEERKAVESKQSVLIDSLYSHHRELAAVFSFFDKDGDGKISREEFRTGCELLAQMAQESEAVLVQQPAPPQDQSPCNSPPPPPPPPLCSPGTPTSPSSVSALFRDSDALLDIMDIHKTGVIDLNEFFELFRVSDVHKNKRAALAEKLPAHRRRRRSMQTKNTPAINT